MTGEGAVRGFMGPQCVELLYEGGKVWLYGLKASRVERRTRQRKEGIFAVRWKRQHVPVPYNGMEPANDDRFEEQ